MTVSASVAAALAGVAGVVASGGRGGGGGLLGSRLQPHRVVRGGAGGAGEADGVALPAKAAPAATALVALLLLTGHGGLAVPLGLAAAALIAPSRRRSRTSAARDAWAARDLPRVADLMATCLAAGLAPADAITLVCDVVGGPVADDLGPVAAAIRAGVDPHTAWSGLASQGRGEAVRRVARAFSRAAATGAPLAQTLATVADDEQERLQWDAQAAARRAGVLAVGPLAVCFLPAFLLLGVVPVVVGVATDVVSQLR